MKTNAFRAISLFVLIILVFLPVGIVSAQENGKVYGDQVIIDDRFILRKGEVLAGNLTVLSGRVMVREGGHVTGDVLLAGGVLEVAGKIDGTVTVIGGELILTGPAVIDGDIVQYAANYSAEEGAVVNGTVINKTGGISAAQLNEMLPNFRFVDTGSYESKWELDIWLLIHRLIQAAAIGLLSIVMIFLFPQMAAKTYEKMFERPAFCGVIGLVSAWISVPISLLLVLTIVFIPLVPLVWIGLIFVGLFGWISMGMGIGEKMWGACPQPWSILLGVLLLSSITAIFQWVMPFLGSIVIAMFILYGLGGTTVAVLGGDRANRQRKKANGIDTNQLDEDWGGQPAISDEEPVVDADYLEGDESDEADPVLKQGAVIDHEIEIQDGAINESDELNGESISDIDHVDGA